MYAVDFKTFNEFVSKNGLYESEPVIVERPPFILEFKRNDVMMAKVEMTSIDEYKFLKRYPNTGGTKKNIYWIRGNEWKVVDGVSIQELSV